MAKNGRCPAGQYYCYTDKKCKQIPAGFKVVGRAGMDILLMMKVNQRTVMVMETAMVMVMVVVMATAEDP